tara:strand:- start:705 stop:1391 length:687 start_codon:yes stop_codon:yes gene_type:complete
MDMATTDTKFLRNKDLIDQSKLDELTIVGLGGIGSAVVTLASAMGFTKIVGYDDDTLEEHNLSTCVYPHTFLGSTKAHAAEKTAIAHGCPNPQMIPSKWTLTSVLPLSNKVIMGPDNMDARMEVYRGWRANPKREWLIDLRMGALAMEIVTVTKTHDNFIDGWIPQGENAVEPCTAKHTIFTASMAASFGLSQVLMLDKKPYYQYIWIGLLPLSVKKENMVFPKRGEK